MESVGLANFVFANSIVFRSIEDASDNNEIFSG